METLANITAVDHFGFGFPHEEELGVMGKYIFVVAAAQLLAMTIAPKDDKLSGGFLLLWLTANPLLVYWVSKECLSTYIGTIQDRLLNVSPDGVSAVRVFIALQLVGTVVELVLMARLDRSKWSNKLTIVAHHLIAGSGGVQTLIAQRGISCFCAMIATEWSTMFLNMVLFARHPNYKAWVKKYMPWLQLLSGFGLWASFILFRLLLVPYIIYRWVSDHISGHPSAREFSNFEIYWAISGAIFICFLSYAWFFHEIHKGFMNSVSACWKKWEKRL